MPGPAVAAIGASVVGGVASANAQKKAASSASNAQVLAADRASEAQERSAQLSIAETQRQFDRVDQLMSPYVQAGNTALSGQLSLLGLGGAGAQQAAISQIENGPQFQALFDQGENAILQNAAATGGLRGGDTQAALGQFRPSVLNSLIEQQYANLGGLVSGGQNAAAGLGGAAQQAGASISNTLNQQGLANANAATVQGQAQAGNALAQGQASANLFGNLSGGIGALAGAGSLDSLFSGFEKGGF